MNFPLPPALEHRLQRSEDMMSKIVEHIEKTNEILEEILRTLSVLALANRDTVKIVNRQLNGGS
jgi:hypothetical protein